MAEDEERAGGLSRLSVLKGLRLSIYEGLWATVFVMLTGGAFQIGFARHLGANDFVLGLLAGLPAVVGLLQLPASLYIERRGERRRFVAFCAYGGRLAFALIALVALFLPPAARLAAFLVLLTLSSALLTITVPAWTSWMSDLVPSDSRGRYFARRNTLASVVVMLAPLPAAYFLDHIGPSTGFPTLFLLSAVAATACFVLILRQPEPKMVRQAVRENPLRSLAAPLSDPQFRKFLAFAGTVVVGQALAGQFFMAWQVDPLSKGALGLPYLPVQLLGAIAAAAGLALTPVFGYLADKYGPRPVLMIGGWMVLAAPILWLFSVPGLNGWNYPLIVVINILSGAGWAAVGLTQFNLLLSLAPTERRATYMAVFSAFTGVIGGVSPVVGGALMSLLKPVHFLVGPIEINNFKLMFVLTDIIRVLALVVLRGLKVEGSFPTRDVLARILPGARPVTSFRTIKRLAQPGGATERREAVQELGELRSPLALEELVTALDDVALPVRESAARALGEIGDGRAVRPLAAKLFDPAAGIAEQAAHALGFLGDRAATPALIQAAQGPDATVRIAALKALGRLADPAAVEVLRESLDPAHTTRTETACAALAATAPHLSQLEIELCLPRLLSLLNPAHPRGVRLAAARAVEVLGPQMPGVYTPLLFRVEKEAEPAVLAREIGALSAIGRADRRPVVGLLSDLLPLLTKTEGTGLAYLQALEAVANILVPPGAFYAYLGLKGMARDEAVGKLAAEIGKRRETSVGSAFLEAFSEGRYEDVLTRAATLVPELEPLVARAIARDDVSAEEALLALIAVREA